MPYITILYYTVTDLINFLCLRGMAPILSILMNWPSERGLHSAKGITGNDCSQPYNVGWKHVVVASQHCNFFPNLVNFPPLISIPFLPSFSSFLPALGTPLILTWDSYPLLSVSQFQVSLCPESVIPPPSLHVWGGMSQLCRGMSQACPSHSWPDIYTVTSLCPF